MACRTSWPWFSRWWGSRSLGAIEDVERPRLGRVPRAFSRWTRRRERNPGSKGAVAAGAGARFEVVSSWGPRVFRRARCGRVSVPTVSGPLRFPMAIFGAAVLSACGGSDAKGGGAGAKHDDTVADAGFSGEAG